MKLLLINTPIDIKDILGNFTSVYNDMKMVPTGLASLAAYVRQAGVQVRILDQYAECLPMDKVLEQIRNFVPNLIGLSVTTPNYYAALNLARDIKAAYPETPLVMGGYHPSILAEETLAEACVDYVIRDEGEPSLLKLCQALDDGGRGLEHIPGLSYKTASGQVHNPRSLPLNLDELPFPAYDLLPMHLYSSPSYTKFAAPVFQMIASRGCPFKCSYCINAEQNVSARYRRRNVKLVVEEMQLLVERFGARQIQFWDPIFPLGRKHAFEFCQEIIDRGLQHRMCWNSTTRAESLTEDMIGIMTAAGCKGIGFGIESGVPELLTKVNKKFNLEKTRRILKIARGRGLMLLSGFIIGFPGETKAMTRQTIEFAKSLDLHYAQFSIMIPYPGTPLFKQLEAAGEIADFRRNDYSAYNQNIGNTDLEPVYVPRGWTADELKRWQKRAYMEFYIRPRLVLMHLRHLNRNRLTGLIRGFLAIFRMILPGSRR